jgi:hypothetical protein
VTPTANVNDAPVGGGQRFITAGIKLMHEIGYKQQEIEERLLMTVDMVMLAGGLSEREQSETLH